MTLDSPEKLAFFFVNIGMADKDLAGCEHEIEQQFPGSDGAAVMAAAIAEDEVDEAVNDAAIERDHAAAKAAEHDLNRSNEGGR
jgi:hypothetical protein